MFTRLTQLCLVILILLSTAIGVQAQTARGSRCQNLDTKFGLLYGSWRWLDADTVMFGVWNGFPDDSMTKSSNAWYQYHPTTGVLEQLNDNPYSQLKVATTNLAGLQLENVQAGSKGLYENVNVSPSQNVIIYPRQDATLQDTWLIDARSKTEVPLGIGLGYTEAVWSADEQKIILTALGNGATYLSPMQLIRLVNGKVTIQRLDQLKPISDILPPTKNYFLHGISADGRYLLITPELAKYETWVIDFSQQKANGLGFYIYGGIKVAWTSPSEFIGIAAALGAIRYDIVTGKQEVLAQPSEIGLNEPNLRNDAFVIGGGSLSPDGHYLMAQGQQNIKQEIVVCKIY